MTATICFKLRALTKAGIVKSHPNAGRVTAARKYLFALILGQFCIEFGYVEAITYFGLSILLYPPQNEVLGGVYWFHPVRPSVRPSVCRQNRVLAVTSLIFTGPPSYLICT